MAQSRNTAFPRHRKKERRGKNNHKKNNNKKQTNKKRHTWIHKDERQLHCSGQYETYLEWGLDQF